MRDGHIIEDHVEVAGPLGQDLPDLEGDLLSLSQELVSIVLGDDRLQDLIPDGWDHTVVVIETNIVQDLSQLVLSRAVQDTQRELDCLHVTGTSSRVDELGTSANLESFGDLKKLVKEYFLPAGLGCRSACPQHRPCSEDHVADQT